jgi:hypothetical protein
MEIKSNADAAARHRALLEKANQMQAEATPNAYVFQAWRWKGNIQDELRVRFFATLEEVDEFTGRTGDQSIMDVRLTQEQWDAMTPVVLD